MVVKMFYVNKIVQMFHSENYSVYSYKEFFADCLKVVVYTDNGKKLLSRSRPFRWFYEHFTFKSPKVQQELHEQIEKIKQVNESKES